MVPLQQGRSGKISQVNLSIKITHIVYILQIVAVSNLKKISTFQWETEKELPLAQYIKNNLKHARDIIWQIKI